MRGRTPPLGPGDVVVITGGARGVTAEVAVALAEAFRPTPPAARPQPGARGRAKTRWLAACRDEAEIKRQLLSARDQRPATPQAIGEQFREIAANREIRRNLGRIEAAGLARSSIARSTSATRRPCATSSPRSATSSGRSGASSTARASWPTGGSRTRPTRSSPGSTTPRSPACTTCSTRSSPTTLEFLVLFSSSTARFGRTGQVAYAAANEVLNKWAQRGGRPAAGAGSSRSTGARGTAAWSTPLRPLFEAEGIALIPPAGRGPAPRRRDPNGDAGPGPVEVVVLADRPAAATPEPARASGGPAAAARTGKLETVFERPVDLDVAADPRSHVIDGQAVLPMALILEWLPRGRCTATRGWSSAGSTTSGCSRGSSCGDREPATVEIAAGKAVRDGRRVPRAGRARGALWPTAARSSTPGARSCSATGTPPGRAGSIDPSSPPALRCRTTRSTAPSCSTARRCRGSSGSRGAASAGSRAGSDRPRRRPTGSTGRSGRAG